MIHNNSWREVKWHKAIAVCAVVMTTYPLCAQEAALDSTAVVVESKALAKARFPRTYADSAVYQGLTVRLDILNPIIDLARTGGHTHSMEAALNIRLKNRFFPTFEFGYAGQFVQEKNATTPVYNGQGEFARIGIDLNPLKKHPEQRSVLLVGIRAATGWQQLSYAVSNTELHNKWIADAWGEVVAGVQVDIVKGFNMGWAVRMKFLFTEKTHSDQSIPYYIPGYGYRDSMKWGFNYYLGYTF